MPVIDWPFGGESGAAYAQQLSDRLEERRFELYEEARRIEAAIEILAYPPRVICATGFEQAVGADERRRRRRHVDEWERKEQGRRMPEHCFETEAAVPADHHRGIVIGDVVTFRMTDESDPPELWREVLAILPGGYLRVLGPTVDVHHTHAQLAIRAPTSKKGQKVQAAFEKLLTQVEELETIPDIDRVSKALAFARRRLAAEMDLEFPELG